MKNKKAQFTSEGLIILWRLMLIAALVIFVALTVGNVMTSKQDVRNVEASLLANKVMGCISQRGVINSNFSVEGCFSDGEIYVNANLSSFESKFSKESFSGNPAIKVFCGAKENQKSLYCAEQTYYSLINNGGKIERGSLTLLIGIQKYGYNVQ